MTRYQFLNLKRYVEQFLMSPFVLLGRLSYWVWGNKEQDYSVYFFLPIYGVGGAEYINAHILEALNDKKILVLFTRKSKDSSTLHLFQHPNTEIKDISKWTDNKLLYFANFFLRGYYAAMIQRNKSKTLVFNAQCNFAYKLCPHLPKRVPVLELIHLFDPVFANVWVPFISFLKKRFCFSTIEINTIETYAQQAGVPAHYLNRFIKLRAFAKVPQQYIVNKKASEVLNVFYAGRGTTQKRLWLHFEIARRVKALGLPIQFHYVGNFQDELPNDIDQLGKYYGIIASGEKMYQFMQGMDLLLLTSGSEGFPVILLESMPFGIIPVVTPVGEMSQAIRPFENGILLDNSNEEAVIRTGVEAIVQLASDKILCQKIAVNIRSDYERLYRFENFTKEIQQQIDACLVP